MQEHDGRESSEDATIATAGPSKPQSLGVLPGHDIGSLIARGGMGAVYRAQQGVLEREVAVKVMSSSAQTSEMAERFRREALVLGRLEHPNIVPIYDMDSDEDGQPFYTMKLVRGRTLQAILHDLLEGNEAAKQEHALSSLLTVFVKVCDAIAFAHSKGILHRDLKPENVMVGEFGEVQVMDWGLAKRFRNDDCGMRNEVTEGIVVGDSEFPNPNSDIGATLQGSVMGTPQYMSPEQARGEIDELDERSDIFSLGGILYAILTLRPPVEGASSRDVLEKVKSGSITSPSDLIARGSTNRGKRLNKEGALASGSIQSLPHSPRGLVPSALSVVAMKALHPEKKERYPSVAALSEDVVAYQRGFATSAEQAGALRQLSLLMSRHKAVTLSLAVMVLLSLAFVWRVMASERRASHNAEIAVAEREAARKALAKLQLDLAEKEFERGKFVEAQRILEQTEESYRDANWRFLKAHSRDFSQQVMMSGEDGADWLEFLPSGDRFITRCAGGLMGIFDTTGQQIGDWIHVLRKRHGAFGVDQAGHRLAFRSGVNEVTVKSLIDNAIINRWTCDLGELQHVLLSPDGEILLAAGGKKLIAYATKTAETLWTTPFLEVIPAFSPDGGSVAALAAKDGVELKVQIMDATTGSVEKTLEATADNHTQTSLQFDRSGGRLVCLGGGEMIVWNPRSGVKTRALHFPGEMVLRLSPSGDAVVTVNEYRLRLWDSRTGMLIRSFNGASTPINNVAFSPDGRRLISSHWTGGTGFVHVWPTRVGDEVLSVRPQSSNGSCVAFDRTGSTLFALAGRHGGGWEIDGGKQTWKFPVDPIIHIDLAVHPTDDSVVLSQFKTPAFTHLGSANEVWQPFGANRDSSVQFSRNGELLVTVDYPFIPSSPGLAFSVIDYGTRETLRRILLTNPRQPFAAFCLNDAVIATAAKAGGITYWNWKTGENFRQIGAAETGSVHCLASSVDGRLLATGSPDRWIRIWEAETGHLKSSFRAHWEGVGSLAFSPDGREILSGSDLGAVRIHEVATGDETAVFYGFTTPVVSVVYSADGKLIAAMEKGGTAKAWRFGDASPIGLPSEPR